MRGPSTSDELQRVVGESLDFTPPGLSYDRDPEGTRKWWRRVERKYLRARRRLLAARREQRNPAKLEGAINFMRGVVHAMAWRGLLRRSRWHHPVWGTVAADGRPWNPADAVLLRDELPDLAEEIVDLTLWPYSAETIANVSQALNEWDGAGELDVEYATYMEEVG